MRVMSRIFVVVAVLLAGAGASGSAFDAKHVPAAAKWVLHVDVDAIRSTETWKMIDPALQSNPAFAKGVSDIELISGLQFPQGLHDVMLYGTTFKDDAVAIVIHATVDEARLMAGIQSDPDYSAGHYGTRDIHGWHDKGKPMFGAFCGNEIMVISNSEAPVKTFLDVLDSKTQTLKADAGLAAGAKPGIVAYIAGSELAQLKEKAKTPLVADVDLVWFSAAEKENNLVLKASVTAKSVDTAQQLKAMADGMKAFLALASKADNAEPPVKILAELLKDATTALEEKTVTAQCPVSLEMVKKLIDLALAQRPAPEVAK